MYMAKQIKDSLTMKPVGILRASIKLSYLKKNDDHSQRFFVCTYFSSGQ